MKHVQEWAQEQQKEWENPQEMGAMLGQKEKGADREKADQDESASRGQEPARRLGFSIGMIMVRHPNLLSISSTDIATLGTALIDVAAPSRHA
jgi:hypothetical protein